MMKNALTQWVDQQGEAISIHDRVQIALAIAEENLLKSILSDCTPAIAPPHLIGDITSSIGVPLEAKRSIDGIIQFESINCLLLDDPVETDPQLAQPAYPAQPVGRSAGKHHSLTRCESEMQTLGQAVPLAQAISILAHSGFSPGQVNNILNLPYEAWHKSWWATLDAQGNFSIPFLRLIRTLRYSDGTFTLQYKDFYGQDKPLCFKSLNQKVVVEIKRDAKSFHKTLEKINVSREHFGTDKAVLICSDVTELEARGYISQGISIYSATDPLMLAPANCTHCINHDCPMQGRADSPVVTCRRFCLDAWTD